MANIELARVKSIYCYIVPRDLKLHYFLHIVFLWDEEFDLDSVLISKNNIEPSIDKGNLASILFNVLSCNEFID